jgi:hypothetical protein
MDAAQERIYGDLEIKMQQMNVDDFKTQSKHGRIGMLLNVIETLSRGYVGDKTIKDDCSNEAAKLLLIELKLYNNV